jgi:hypothetical protein
MPRTINAATIAALQSDQIKMCHLVQIDFDEVVRITDNFHPVAYEGNTFLPAGHLLSIQEVQETEELRVGSLKVSLSAVDQAYVSLFLNINYLNRRIQIWNAVLDSAGAIIGDPISTFDGDITGYAITDNKREAIISVTCASHWADFERKAGRLTNNNSQQYFFPNDTGFQYAADSTKDIKWGRA